MITLVKTVNIMKLSHILIWQVVPKYPGWQWQEEPNGLLCSNTQTPPFWQRFGEHLSKYKKH